MPTNVRLHFMNEIALGRSRSDDMDLGIGSPTPDQEREYSTAETALRMQMISKLLDFEKRHLQLALDYVQMTDDAGIVAGIHRLDLFVRYLTTAKRDFYRALKEYRQTKNA